MSQREREKTDSNMSRVEISRVACMRQHSRWIREGGGGGDRRVLELAYTIFVSNCRWSSFGNEWAPGHPQHDVRCPNRLEHGMQENSKMAINVFF